MTRIGLLVFFVLLACTSVSFAEDIIAKESASGSRNLRPFTVKDGWEVRWESSDQLYIFLHDQQGNTLGKAASQPKAGSGQSYQPKGGTYFLSVVASTSAWTITVVQLP